MSNDYFEAPTPLTAGSLARASHLNSRMASLEAGFELLPDRLPLFQNRLTYLTAVGTADAIAVTLDPVPAAYVEGLRLVVKIASTNTGAATINVNALGNKSIKRPDGTALQAGDLTAGNVIDLVYDGINFKIVGSGIVAAQAAAAVASASAAATSASNAATSAAAAAASEAAAAASASSINDANIVHRTGAESVGGLKTFTDGIIINGQTLDGLTAGGVAMAELTGAADKGVYFTSASAAATFDLTSVARTLLAQTTQALMRTAGLGLGTAATVNTGTSGAAIPLLDGVNTFSGVQTIATVGGPLTVNSTNSNGPKVTLSDAGVAKGYLGSGSAGAALFNSSAALRLELTANGVDFTNSTTMRFPSMTTTASAGNVFADSADLNRIYRSTSNPHYKDDIQEIEDQYLDAVYKVNPIWFRSNPETVPDANPEHSHYGYSSVDVFNADIRLVNMGYFDEDFEEVPDTPIVLRELVRAKNGKVAVDKDGKPVERDVVIAQTKRVLKAGAELKPDGVQYERVNVLKIEKQRRLLASLEARVARLEATITGALGQPR